MLNQWDTSGRLCRPAKGEARATMPDDDNGVSQFITEVSSLALTAAGESDDET